MFCTHCGSEMPENAKFCTSCGAPVEAPAPAADPVSEPFAQPAPEAPVTNYNDLFNPQPAAPANVGFVQAVVSFFTRYTDFGGRSRRSEYWWVSLFLFVVDFVMGILFGSGSTLAGIWGLAILVPSLALAVRRLHDVGKRGTYLLWFLLPVVGWIFVLLQMVKDSDPGANQFGPSPKYM